jgi:hypothetical protein
MTILRPEVAYKMTLQAVGREPGNVHYRVRAVEVLERQQRPYDAVRKHPGRDSRIPRVRRSNAIPRNRSHGMENAKPLTMVLPPDVVEHALLIATMLVAGAEDNRKAS